MRRGGEKSNWRCLLRREKEARPRKLVQRDTILYTRLMASDFKSNNKCSQPFMLSNEDDVRIKTKKQMVKDIGKEFKKRTNFISKLKVVEEMGCQETLEGVRTKGWNLYPTEKTMKLDTQDNLLGAQMKHAEKSVPSCVEEVTGSEQTLYTHMGMIWS